MSESHELDKALSDATEELASSLRVEEKRRRQRQALIYGTIVFCLVVATPFVLLSNPQWFDQTESEENQAVHKGASDSTRTSSKVRAVIEGAFLAGDFTMTLPKGFEWQVSLEALDRSQYRLTSERKLNSLGVYRLENDLLIMQRPDDPRLTEFQWQVIDKNHLELVAEPPVAKTGSTYLGAELTRNFDR